MLPKKLNPKLFFLGLFIVAVFVDQVTKLIFLRYSVATINKDLAFSLIYSNPLALNIIALIVFSIGIYLFAKGKVKTVALSLVFAGGLSNILDRIVRGGVVDFINLKIFPSFNLADSFITIGAVLIIYSIIRDPKI